MLDISLAYFASPTREPDVLMFTTALFLVRSHPTLRMRRGVNFKKSVQRYYFFWNLFGIFVFFHNFALK